MLWTSLRNTLKGHGQRPRPRPGTGPQAPGRLQSLRAENVALAGSRLFPCGKFGTGCRCFRPSGPRATPRDEDATWPYDTRLGSGDGDSPPPPPNLLKEFVQERSPLSVYILLSGAATSIVENAYRPVVPGSPDL